MPLPTAEQVRNMGVKGLSGSGADPRLEALIAAADTLIAMWALFPAASSGLPTLEEASYVQFRNGPSGDDPERIDLRLRPIVAISSVLQDINGDWTYTQELVQNTDFTLAGANSGSLYRIPTSEYTWLRGRRTIRIACTAGYDVGASALLTLCIAMQVAYWWSTPGSTAPGVVNLSQGGTSLSRAPMGAPVPEVQQMLASLRLHERWGLPEGE